jgi:prephenate dehydratase
MKIGYLGPKNSFTYQAACEIFSQEVEMHPFGSIPMCIQALVTGKIQRAVVPNENSLEGSVHATIDTLFRQKGLTIEEEVILPIKHQLLTAQPEKELQKIISHPQALAQCTEFLQTHYPNTPIEAVASTTAAATFVAEHPKEKVAAIASKEAAIAYNLFIQGADIQDNTSNQTRFWVLRKEDSETQVQNQATKATIFVTLPKNRPGGLHQILASFSWRGIDLSKIESRPLKTSLGEYFFVIDLVLNQPWALIENAFQEIQLLDCQVQLLGAYGVIEVGEK